MFKFKNDFVLFEDDEISKSNAESDSLQQIPNLGNTSKTSAEHSEQGNQKKKKLNRLNI